MYQINNKKAFSILEISVLLVIVGLIFAAIAKSSSMLNSARISTARSLTIDSKISEIQGIIAWYETSMIESFSQSETIDNSQVTKWYDISSMLSIEKKLNTLNKTPSSSVVYRAKGINNLPSLHFTSSGNIKTASFYQGKSDANTVFVVFSPTPTTSITSSSRLTLFDSGSSSALSNSFALSSLAGYFNSTDFNFSGISIKKNDNYIVSLLASQSNKKLFINSNTAKTSISSLGINSFEGLTVATTKTGSLPFTGLISEIIIFNRILKDEERKTIMNYLSKKYNIKIN